MKERLRAEGYRLLSACFCLPQKEIFLQENLFPFLTSLLNQICVEAVPYASEMEASFQKSSEEELRIEYARLFVGPYELKAPPYGSIYLEEERRVMGDTTLEVIQLYQEAGLVVEEELKEPPDHIAIELEFMYYLFFKEAEALEKAEIERALIIREMRRRFFDRFLRPWVPLFCQKIKDSTENPYYLSLANCLATFIIHQSQSLS